MMTEAKICGISTPEAMTAAVDGGADYVGLVFYEPSPRYVTPAAAAALAAPVPPSIVRTGLYVDASDAVYAATVHPAGLGLLQLHGDETPERVQELRGRYGVPVMKVIKVRETGDLAGAEAFYKVADRLLFDAKPPSSMKNPLPGGNAVSFDWTLLAGRTWLLPWMLSGGLTPENVQDAIAITGAPAVDVSSGVEDASGVKNSARIAAFLEAVHGVRED